MWYAPLHFIALPVQSYGSYLAQGQIREHLPSTIDCEITWHPKIKIFNCIQCSNWLRYCFMFLREKDKVNEARWQRFAQKGRTFGRHSTNSSSSQTTHQKSGFPRRALLGTSTFTSNALALSKWIEMGAIAQWMNASMDNPFRHFVILWYPHSLWM